MGKAEEIIKAMAEIKTDINKLSKLMKDYPELRLILNDVSERVYYLCGYIGRILDKEKPEN